MCCGASRRVGMLPQIPILLGDDDGQPARFAAVVDDNLIPNVRAGAQRYVKGSGVDPAFKAGKLQTVENANRSVRIKRNTKFLVTLPNGKVLRFGVKRTAEQYAKQSGGVLTQESPNV